MSFAPLVADDAVHCDGQAMELGPYEYQPGVPPFILDFPIEKNLVPLPAHKIPVELIVEGDSELLFELLDTQREIHGNTAVFLVRDCGIYLEQDESTTLHWVSHDVEIEGFTSNLDLASGDLSELLEDREFSRSCFLGAFIDTTQVIDHRPAPSAGQGYYYLVNGTCAEPIGYGDSSLDPNPRDTLPPAPTCP